MHASLPVRAYVAFKRPGHGPHCTHPACAALPLRQRPYGTYTHLFLECPLFRPAVEWLKDLWEAISGARPPDDPSVLLGDHKPSWPQYPRTPPRQQLWTFLRVTVLHHIWSAHSKPGPAEDRAARVVVQRCIQSITDTMRQLFYRSARHEHLIEHLPRALLTQEVVETGLQAFLRVWCDGAVLCTVALGQGDGTPRLHVHLSETLPISAPA
jgi:hypothetical protein